MPRLSRRTHLLSVILDLIRTGEKTDAFFTGRERENAISVRRSQVEYAERYTRDDPYIPVVDIARDLLRESVRDHGVSDAIRYLDDRSEMIRRLAVDALAEARSTDADALIKILIQLREALREQIRTAWSYVSTSIPRSNETFIQLHAICFAFEFGASDPEWAEAFLAHAPESERERWIGSVAHYLDQDGKAGEFQDLIFAHWNHRLDGHAISEAGQRALLRWLTLPGIDVPRAAELFVRGPAIAVCEEAL